jgi:glycosyltransferase involved in cell wall biosynthesis
MYSVSVVTPSFRQGRFIERTIESVLSQEFPGSLEYFVMDGGSTDETVGILKRYGDRLQWVSEKDRGQAHAVNKGLARAQGDIIGWLNSDDVYYPNAVAAACLAFDRNPDVDVIYGRANHIAGDDSIIEPYPIEDWNFERLLSTCFICQPAVFIRRNVFTRFGGLNEKLHFCLDYEYWIRLGRQVKFLPIPEVLAGSRLHAETKTLGSRIPFHREINDMLYQHVRRVPDSWLYNYAHAVLDEKGIARSDRVKFPILVGLLSILASLRWNHGVSGDLGRTTSGWIKSGVQNYFTRIRQR